MTSGAGVRTIEAARRGDAEAFGQLWADANPALLRYLTVVSGDRAGELAARTWVELAGKLRRFRGDELAWRRLVFSTARACARKSGGSERTAKSVPPGPTAWANRPDTLGGALTRVALDLLAALPEPQGEAILLRTAGRLGVADTARVLKLSGPTVMAAVHAGLAQAGALAADSGLHGPIDRREAVAEPPEWEVTGFVAGLGVDESAFERLLAGRSAGAGAPARIRLIASVLSALTAPPTQSELLGSGIAHAGFAAQFARRPRHAPGALPLGSVTWRFGSRAAVAAAAGAIGLSGVVAAAYAGLLPQGLQDTAHHWINAPAPSPARHVGPGPGSPGSSELPAPAATAVSTSARPKTRPGSTKTPPGSTKTPPGSTRTPPGSTKTPPGSAKTPPGSAKTPPGSTKTPPGSAKTAPSATKSPPKSTHSPPAATRTTRTPPGSTRAAPGSTRAPPGATNRAAGKP